MSAAADAHLVPHALPEGLVLFDRYRVGRQLAEGAVASVYAGHDTVTEAAVALKVFDPLRGADPLARARFAREFEVLSGLNHPGVARALRFEEDPRFDVLVMELVEGESLRARMDRARLSWPEASELGRRLCEALEACHRAGVVHRDLKPANVVLHPDRGPVILDFGTAWFSSALTLTRTGAVLGSPRYLAPELFDTTHVDARADVFGLGAVLYEALSGRPVREVESMAELAAREGPDAPPPLTVLRPDLPAETWPVIERSLAHRPEDRYATAAELGAALTGQARALGRRLEARLTCSSCGTSLVIDLPICPGCGVRADWALDPGPYAVQLLEIADPQGTARWLRRRYGGQLNGARWLRGRLSNPPVPLAVGVCERSAESLAAQAREHGCRAEVLRGRAVVGPALRIPAASPAEILGASAAHFSVVAGLGAGLALFEAPLWAMTALPAAAAAVGVAGAMRYARRPLLRVRGDEGVQADSPAFEPLRARLASLSTTRARRLAAAAVARAAPVLVGDDAGLPDGAREDVQEALTEALVAVQEVDAHQAELAAHAAEDPRAPRAAALEAATRVGVAHDLAARRALEACRRITAALSTRAE